MPRRRVRRPLLALLVLIAALLIGYLVRAGEHGHHTPRPVPSTSATRTSSVQP